MNKIKLFAVESTNACNGGCSYCPVGQGIMTRQVGYLDPEVLKTVLKRYESCFQTIEPFRYIHQEQTLELHNFGEPLLHPRLDKVVKIVSDSGINPIVGTNGSLLTRELSQKLKEAGLKTYHIQWNRFKPFKQSINAAKLGIDTLVIVLTPNATFPDKTIITQNQINKLKEAGARIYLKRLRNFEGKENFLEKHDCVWLKENWKVMLWNGDIVTCCNDYNADSVIGHYNKDDIKVNIPYSKCKDCAGYAVDRDYEGIII